MLIVNNPLHQRSSRAEPHPFAAMGDDALIKNVFGSDSDSDSDDGPAAKPAVSPAKGDDAQKDRPAEDAPEDGAEAAGRPAGFKSSLEENLSDFEDDEEKKEEEFGTRSRTHARAPRSPIALLPPAPLGGFSLTNSAPPTLSSSTAR